MFMKKTMAVVKATAHQFQDEAISMKVLARMNGKSGQSASFNGTVRSFCGE
jgi:hypothetical protein